MPSTNSLLRYPGGKSQLSKYIEFLLDINDISGTYIEPFAGGFGVALYLLYNDKVDNVVMNDYDPSIFSIWNAALNRKDELIELICQTDITLNEWYNQKNIRNVFHDDPYSLENAFATLFLNRTNISGIINGGPIGGKEQRGKYKIDCRFNKKVLISKINRLYHYRDRISLSNMDAGDFISDKVKKYDNKSTFIFFDPPYYRQGKNLYLSFVNEQEHKRLAKQIIELESYKWITTYDKQEEILLLYKPFVQSYEYELRYSANNKRRATEYLFASERTKLKSHNNVILKNIQ